MKLIQTRTFGSGRVFLMVSDKEFEAIERKKEDKEKSSHLRKLRSMSAIGLKSK